MNLILKILDGELAVLQLRPDAPVPSWLKLSADPLVSITQTPEEISVVCPASAVPPGVESEKGWRAFKVDAKLEFSEVGILAAVVTPLAEAGISILSISTFDTDYILVRSNALAEAKIVLGRHFQLKPQ